MNVIISKKKAKLLDVKANPDPPKIEDISVWALIPIKLEKGMVLALQNREWDLVALVYKRHWNKDLKTEILEAIINTLTASGYSPQELNEYVLGAGDIEFYLPQKGFGGTLKKLRDKKDLIATAAKDVLRTMGKASPKTISEHIIKRVNENTESDNSLPHEQSGPEYYPTVFKIDEKEESELLEAYSKLLLSHGYDLDKIDFDAARQMLTQGGVSVEKPLAWRNKDNFAKFSEKSPKGMFELTVRLDVGTNYLIERRILVPEECTLEDLAFIINDLYGWSGDEPSEFILYDDFGWQALRVFKKGFENDPPSPQELMHYVIGLKRKLPQELMEDVKLKDIFPEYQKLDYHYSFKDHWHHPIELLSLGEEIIGRTEVPAVLDGVGVAPPEGLGQSFNRFIGMANDEAGKLSQDHWMAWEANKRNLTNIPRLIEVDREVAE